MNKWLAVTAFLAGGVMGIAGLGGCSSKVESTTVGGDSKPAAVESKHEVAPTPQIMSTELRYNRALKLYDEGSYEEAEKELEIVCDAWPKFSKPFKHLARTQLKTGKTEEALENALDAAEMNPKDGTIDNVIGLAYMDLDDFDSAETAFRTAISKNPTFVWAYNNLGYLLIQKKQFADARDVLTEGGKIEKAPSVLFNNLGIALESTGDTVGAKAAFAKAVEMDPTQVNASTNLSRLDVQEPQVEDQKIAQVTESK